MKSEYNSSSLFHTRTDLQEQALAMLRALAQRGTPEAAGYELGSNRAFYGEAATRLETFSRTLWLSAPLSVQGEFPTELIARGIDAGTNPASTAFWGWAGTFDQRFVEMTAIAFALKVAPTIPEHWDAETKARVACWLAKINEGTIGAGNWLFFRIFVNTVLDSLGGTSDPSMVASDLETIESLYLGDGWYGDGGAGTIDYYNSFAFHFYGLLYAKWYEGIDPERCQRFRTRATKFAESFIYWWDSNGSAIPYGRSLVYRFGMASYWAAAAYTDLPIFDHGTLKGLWMRHLRWWFQQDIFDQRGILNLGYAYPNQNMVEFYNAPGSPMWAFKAFLPLALPADDPFWRAGESPFPHIPRQPIALPDGKKVLGRSQTGHAWMISSGHNLPWQGRAFFDKYSKFAYSSVFGFSVTVESTCLGGMAPDSTLILSLNGQDWFGRRTTEDHRSGDDWVESSWEPCPGVRILTRLTITAAGHIREHKIETQAAIEIIEGGFAVPRPAEVMEHLANNPIEDFTYTAADGLAEIQHGSLRTRIEDRGSSVTREGLTYQPWATTHLLFPATVIPLLRAKLAAGQHVLRTEVIADRTL